MCLRLEERVRKVFDLRGVQEHICGRKTAVDLREWGLSLQSVVIKFGFSLLKFCEEILGTGTASRREGYLGKRIGKVGDRFRSSPRLETCRQEGH